MPATVMRGQHNLKPRRNQQARVTVDAAPADAVYTIAGHVARQQIAPRAPPYGLSSITVMAGMLVFTTATSRVASTAGTPNGLTTL